MDHLLVADTNLFFECRRLEDLPWSDLGAGPLIIALTKPVIGEIDKHKKGGGRTRKRALGISGRIRRMLVEGQSESVIREADPRVILRLMPVVPPTPKLEEVLDYTQNDDRIVGIAAALSQQTGYASVVVLTHDAVAASTAKAAGVSFQLIPQSWLRPPEETTEAKKIRELEQDLATYRSQEPVIELSETEAAAAGAHVVRRVAEALPQALVDRLVDELQSRHPMRTDFTPPEPVRLPDGTEISYAAPDAEKIEAYTSNGYPDWMARCRAILESLHEERAEREPRVQLRFSLINSGTRPASRMRVSFEACGSIFLYRRSEDSSVVSDGQHGDEPVPPRLPSPPASPSFPQIVKRIPAVGSDVRGLADLRRHRSTLEDLVQQAAGYGAYDLANMMGISGVAQRYASDLGVMGRANFAEDVSRVPIIPPVRPLHRDPEGFYYDGWPPDVPVERGSLTCELFRHRGDEELFEVEVQFPKDGDASGAVLCTVHAENMTEPLTLRVPVRRTIETYSIQTMAEDMVGRCG